MSTYLPSGTTSSPTRKSKVPQVRSCGVTASYGIPLSSSTQVLLSALCKVTAASQNLCPTSSTSIDATNYLENNHQGRLQSSVEPSALVRRRRCFHSQDEGWTRLHL